MARVVKAVRFPDDAASPRAASAAADRWVTVEEPASKALGAYLRGMGAPSGRALSFMGLGTASSSFSDREAEELIEADTVQV